MPYSCRHDIDHMCYILEDLLLITQILFSWAWHSHKLENKSKCNTCAQISWLVSQVNFIPTSKAHSNYHPEWIYSLYPLNHLEDYQDHETWDHFVVKAAANAPSRLQALIPFSEQIGKKPCPLLPQTFAMKLYKVLIIIQLIWVLYCYSTESILLVAMCRYNLCLFLCLLHPQSCSLTWIIVHCYLLVPLSPPCWFNDVLHVNFAMTFVNGHEQLLCHS